MRTLIDLPENTIQALRRLSSKEKVSRAEVIRRAIARYLEEHPQVEAGVDVFGLWKSRKINSLKYQDELRSEWESK